MADEKTSLFGESQYNSSASEGNNTYYGSNISKDKKAMFAFVGVVTISVLISIILSIVQGAKTKSHGFIFFLLGLSLIGFVAIELFLIRFIKSGDLHESKTWFLYIVGGCAMLESIFTDVLLYQ
ncbi:uncharacterized protein LOC117104338 [Anneissia japonica]|uniref:uncharacterized protein LOC117104338 n=1 Tax=Anneissia japonica TaxID=1529436 RepID=UPI0014259AC8|nr:uncharacterized protein LOC117104338 [Anneissia japonica]XP_033101047.1 uncharacterized protein LOC117104338 [Anneissia japonica]XP_033101049.1 uncharacterized protein LOC117104338 [Anneissia japonica]